jgi:hypothetical protein
MEIKIPKITEPLDLGRYSPALAGQVLQVWVNPPPEKRKQSLKIDRRMKEIDAEEKTLTPDKDPNDMARAAALEKESKKLLEQLDDWLSEIWSQGAEETHLPAEYIRKFRTESYGTDPQLFGWMAGESVRMIMEHLGAVKKA